MVRIVARDGKAVNVTYIPFNVTAPATDSDPQNLDQYRTYGYLASASDYQTYRFYHTTSCGVAVESDVELTEERTSTSITEIVSWQTAAPGWYTVVVKHKSTGSAFALTHQTTNACSSGGPSGGSPDTEAFIQDGNDIHYISI